MASRQPKLPVSAKPGTGYPIKADEFMAMDFKGTCAKVEVCVDNGRTRAIGVSNFSISKLEKLMMITRILPAVNQKSMITSCRSEGMLVVSYSSLGGSGNRSGTEKVIKSYLLAKIGADKGEVRRPGGYEVGFRARDRIPSKRIPGASYERKYCNFRLDDLIDLLPVRACKGGSYISVNGPFRTSKELWDEE